MNQLRLNTGTSDREALAIGMNKQTLVTEEGNHQPSHQLAGSEVDIQRLDRLSMHQQSPASWGINKPIFHSGRGRQQTNGLGVANRQATNSLDRHKKVPFTLFLPVTQPLLDRDQTLQLQTLNQALTRNERTRC
ncbi:hypothetical protein LIER_21523 [Lithospermum erythrorhizon]|uniref:Uncharacterized protein n=1 Tax=Lithospermum erythrorhizon TaxID=34254 RepID=A0AAV3QT03_LITER